MEGFSGCLSGFIGIIILLFGFYCFTVSPIAGIVVIIVAVVILLYFVGTTEMQMIQEKTQNLDKLQSQLGKIHTDQSFNTPELNYRLILDEKNEKFIIVSSEMKLAKKYDYQDILEVTLQEDSRTITTTSRSSQLGGALIGGVLAGGVGAVIGGLSGSQTSTNTIDSVELKIIVHDTINPVHVVKFNKGKGMSKNSAEYKEATKNANHWHALLGYAIKKTDNSVPELSSLNTSLTKQLQELNELKQQGILTEEEFQQQKTKILNNN